MSETDRALSFILPGRHARGRMVRLGRTVQAVLEAHGYPPVIERLLAEALTVTALLGAMLKNSEGQLTMQAQTEAGPVGLMVCDYKAGALRGYVQYDPDRLAELPPDPALIGLFGKGYLAITFDQAVSGERYQGIVPLEGACLADAIETYFTQSEQIPSMVRVAVGPDSAGGMLVQHLPEGEEGRERIHTRLDHPEWEHVAALAGTISPVELLDAGLTLETLVWRLFNEEAEIRVLDGAALSKGCRCDPAHIRDVLGRFPDEERQAMADESGAILVDCAFCAKTFEIAG